LAGLSNPLLKAVFQKGIWLPHKKPRRRGGMDEAWKPYLFLHLDRLYNALDTLNMPEDVS